MHLNLPAKCFLLILKLLGTYVIVLRRNIYRILQIVRGGKVSRLQNSTVIHWKTFAVGPSRATNLQILIAPTRKEGFCRAMEFK